MLFDTVQNIRPFDEARVCDLFAGSGALGLEAVSRGAATVDFVERDRTASGIILSNATALGCNENIKIHTADVRAFLRQTFKPYDIIFADPPYDVYETEEVWNFIRESTAVTKGTVVVIEHRTDKAIESKELLQTKKVGDSSFSILRIRK